MRRFTTASLALTIAATGILAGALAVAAQDGSDLKIGLVTDVGTIDDRNFNQYSWEGAVAGAEAIGAAEPQYAISQQSADIGPNIQAFVDQDYDIIVTIGFAAGADTINGRPGQPGHQVHRRRPGALHQRGRHPGRHLHVRRRSGRAPAERPGHQLA